MHVLIFVKCSIKEKPEVRFLTSSVQEFPILSKLDPEVYGNPESAITRELIEEELNGMSVEEVLLSTCRI